MLVNFQRPVPLRVVQDLQRLPGVIHAEPYRSEPVRVRLRGRSEDTALIGYRAGRPA